MKTYTFIANFRGGTYISQYTHNSLEEALYEWANKFNFVGQKKEKRQLLEKITDTDDNFYSPAKLDTLVNVWCTVLTINRSFLLLNIVQTDIGDHIVETQKLNETE
jgi:acyl-CoA thioesterase FadM